MKVFNKNRSRITQAILSLLMMVVLSTGCEEFLDVPVEDRYVSENFFNDPANVSLMVNDVYVSLKRGGLFSNGIGQNAITSDIQRTAQFNSQGGLGTYTHSASNAALTNIWQGMYQGIAKANNVLEEIEKHVPADLDVSDQIGEVRFIRALYYFNLVQLFGDVPLIVNTIQPDDEPMGRTDRGLVYEQIIEDLTFASNNCLLASEQSDYGRVSKGAAQALLSKVYLTRANMIDLGQLDGDAAADYQGAVDNAKSVIDSNEYGLVSYFPDVFNRNNKGHNENIFVIQYMPGEDLGGCVGCATGISKQQNDGGSWNNILGTQYYYTLYDDTDLVRRKWTVTKASLEIINGEIAMTSYENPRYFANLLESKNRDATTYFFNGGDQTWPTWEPTRVAKFRRWPLSSAEQGFFNHQAFNIDDPIIRYAEVLLIYAEALNEVNNGPSAAAYDAVNEVRARARNYPADGIDYLIEGLTNPDIDVQASAVPDWSGLSYTEFRDNILDERARELGGEQGCMRWFDLVRRGILVEKIQYLNTFDNPLTGGQEEPWWSNNQGPGMNVQPHHLLMPIPADELDKNPNLKQNPGY
ncbi:RagB/SusD family nutrient uptake outer membrane protein [Reichenbachiella ulvae]|uniref:RagB/SusD family nutrient uptake outer membrane protein n=1 Tax=Reichenbachiella ulvae TaxID=2980104 RepID=A0ABT3D015_9BACT|nr:RagB/SusD family nutrient uptake outer membrane protein [Reichenbachiella ulvae]MCV9389290.1 RagB/SusD family nutrient uptake outer membrane protein [Reichenbachiella ulvae]